MNFEPIGFLTSDFKTKFGTPRQSLLANDAQSALKIRRDLQPELCLQGLEGFSHLWVIYVFHQNSNKIFRPKIHPPRLSGDAIGVFATRSPHRPNPIGLSLAKIERIEGDTVYLSGLDVIEGTPVLDIKPYLKSVESLPQAEEGWVTTVPSAPLTVSFYQDFDATVRSLGGADLDVDRLQRLITQSVQNDPRPLAYKENPNHKDTHAMYLDRWNVFFEFRDDGVFISRIESI